jgi:hypothetical protein
MSIDRRVLPVFGLASIVSCANEPQSPLPARPPNATFASAGADAQTIAASHANADQEQPTRVDADAPVRRTSIVVRQPPVPAGWVSVVPFAASAFSKATVFFRHGYSEPRACVAWRYAGHLITVVENASSAFGASGLNLAGVGVGPDLGPLRRRTRYKMVLESGTLARGPYRFHSRKSRAPSSMPRDVRSIRRDMAKAGAAGASRRSPSSPRRQPRSWSSTTNPSRSLRSTPSASSGGSLTKRHAKLTRLPPRRLGATIDDGPTLSGPLPFSHGPRSSRPHTGGGRRGLGRASRTFVEKGDLP